MHNTILFCGWHLKLVHGKRDWVHVKVYTPSMTSKNLAKSNIWHIICIYVASQEISSCVSGFGADLFSTNHNFRLLWLVWKLSLKHDCIQKNCMIQSGKKSILRERGTNWFWFQTPMYKVWTQFERNSSPQSEKLSPRHKKRKRAFWRKGKQTEFGFRANQMYHVWTQCLISSHQNKLSSLWLI